MESSQNKNAMMWLPLIVVCIAQVGTSGDNSVLSMSTNEFITKLGASMDRCSSRISCTACWPVH